MGVFDCRRFHVNVGFLSDQLPSELLVHGVNLEFGVIININYEVLYIIELKGSWWARVIAKNKEYKQKKNKQENVMKEYKDKH